MQSFIVTGSYQTQGGNLASFNFEIAANSNESAMIKAERRVKADNRRKYGRSLDMNATARGV